MTLVSNYSLNQFVLVSQRLVPWIQLIIFSVHYTAHLCSNLRLIPRSIALPVQTPQHDDMSALFLLPPVVDWAWEIESCGNREVDMGIQRVDTRWWYLTKDLETLFRHVCPRVGGQSILKATALPLTVQDSGDWLVQTSIFPSLDTSSYLSFSRVTWHIPHMVQSPRTFLIPVYWKWVWYIYFYEPKASENAAHKCNNRNMHANECNKIFVIHYHSSVVSLLT